MKTVFRIIIIPVSFLVFFGSCEKVEIDKTKPEIDLTIQDAFPGNCDTIWFGETFTFKVLFSDNVELGAFSIDIHNNFDHHSHSTEFVECNLNPKKDPVNPFVFIDDFSIPEGSKEHYTNVSIAIPAENENGLFDEGDYHFYIRITDKEGWSTQKGLSIKMFN